MEKHKKSKSSVKRASVTNRSVRDVMDIRQLAVYLGLGKSKIYDLIRQKKIPASRIGRQYRFSKVVIDQWLNEKLITRHEDSQMHLFAPALNVQENETNPIE